jgi:glycosyltransferase involved in cell wall biosynthesis
MKIINNNKSNLVKIKKVAILLCTYQGEEFLADQLDSISGQTHNNWHVYVSDDGSDDATSAILRDYQQKWSAQRLTICEGPKKGFAENFLSLVCNTQIDAEYFAYSDQDDIWEPGKLTRAIELLQKNNNNLFPALYCSRTILINAKNEVIGFSPLFKEPPSFVNALTQNIGGGNTMVFNASARRLLMQAGSDLSIVSHDWWTYLVVSGCGGNVYYDSLPLLRYRQHTGNLVGTNISWSGRLNRVMMLFQGVFRKWNDKNIKALNSIKNVLTDNNKEILHNFENARSMWLLPRLYYLRKCGIYRQTIFGNLGLVLAAVFNKI